MLKIIPNKFIYSGVGSSDTVPVGDGLYLHKTIPVPGIRKKCYFCLL